LHFAHNVFGKCRGFEPTKLENMGQEEVAVKGDNEKRRKERQSIAK
jgi:hypothetical protein